VNFYGALRVPARGSALPVSDRKIGSANGNRTCLTPVQLGSVESICFILRSPRTAATAKTAPLMADVAARWQRATLKTPSKTTSPAAVREFEKPDSSREACHVYAS